MKWFTGLLLAFFSLMLVTNIYAGSGYEPFPKSDYMKRRMGEVTNENAGQTPLERFYLLEQKSLKEKQTEPSVESSSTEIAAQPQSPSDYILGPGDVLDISVWKDEALSKVVPILPDGAIYFPLIGKISTTGKTVMGLRQEIENKISKYASHPFVNVSVQQVNSMLIYVIGKVHNPGRFVITSNITVLQALSIAGGLNTFAKGDKIKIIRNTGEQQQMLDFHYDDAAEGRDLSQNFRLQRGDIIVVN